LPSERYRALLSSDIHHYYEPSERQSSSASCCGIKLAQAAFVEKLAAWLQQFAEPALLGDLRNAFEQGFPITYRDYDWSVNADVSTS